MAKFFIYPFAYLGDKTTIPDAAQPDGSVSYTMGFTSDYQLIYGTDPNAKAVPRFGFNELMYDVTDAIRQYQTEGFPDFITSLENGGVPYPYDINAIVRYNPGSGVQLYISLVNSNTALPTDATKWANFSPSQNSGQYAKVVGSGTQAIIVQPSLINFNTVVIDPDGLFHGAPNHSLQPVKFNGYRIGGYIRIFAIPEPKDIQLFLYKNGAPYSVLCTVYAREVVTGQDVDLFGSDVAEANGTTDYFQLYVGFDGSSGIDLAGGQCYFNIDSA